MIFFIPISLCFYFSLIIPYLIDKINPYSINSFDLQILTSYFHIFVPKQNKAAEKSRETAVESVDITPCQLHIPTPILLPCTFPLYKMQNKFSIF